MKEFENQIETWIGELDDAGRLHLPAAARLGLGWSGGQAVVMESDRMSLRILSVETFSSEICGR